MDTIEARKKSNINQERRKQPETCTLFQTELIHNLSTNDFYSLNLTLTTAILVPNKLFIIILVILSFLSLKSPILSLTIFFSIFIACSEYDNEFCFEAIFWNSPGSGNSCSPGWRFLIRPAQGILRHYRPNRAAYSTECATEYFALTP